MTILIVLTVDGCGRMEFELTNTREAGNDSVESGIFDYSDEGHIVEYPEPDSGIVDAGTIDSEAGDATTADSDVGAETPIDAGDAGTETPIDAGDAGTETPIDAESPDSEQETGPPDSGEVNLCDGINDDDYVETPTSCGLGVCASVGTLSCVDGVEIDSCTPGSVTGADDDCDGLDDDCDGSADEHYVPDASCGLGVCAPESAPSSCVDGVETPCLRGTPPNGNDDEGPPGDGLDNDCDGLVDEDVPCDTSDVTIADTASGQNISVPVNCTSVTVRLWGGGGGGGGNVCDKNGGNGGSGGYTTVTLNDLTGTEFIDISIGGGGISGCGNLSGGTGMYQGGDGGDAAFLNSEDGNDGFGPRTGGSGGSVSSGGGVGGDGKDGGGGGGSGNPNLFSLGLVGNGGGGGGASVLIIDAVEIATAGGGGGGGGASGSILTLCVGSVVGHDGGTRCSADGDDGTQAGAGGGSGACFPAGIPWSVPPGSHAMGGTSCTDGNDGFAMVKFAP